MPQTSQIPGRVSSANVFAVHQVSATCGLLYSRQPIITLSDRHISNLNCPTESSVPTARGPRMTAPFEQPSYCTSLLIHPYLPQAAARCLISNVQLSKNPLTTSVYACRCPAPSKRICSRNTFASTSTSSSYFAAMPLTSTLVRSME